MAQVNWKAAWQGRSRGHEECGITSHRFRNEYPLGLGGAELAKQYDCHDGVLEGYPLWHDSRFWATRPKAIICTKRKAQHDIQGTSSVHERPMLHRIFLSRSPYYHSTVRGRDRHDCEANCFRIFAALTVLAKNFLRLELYWLITDGLSSPS